MKEWIEELKNKIGKSQCWEDEQILKLIAEIEQLEKENELDNADWVARVLHLETNYKLEIERLNKVYRQRYSLLEKIKETTKELLNILPKIPIIAPVIDRLERLIAEYEEKKWDY